MKRILYSALIIPNDTKDSYLRTAKLNHIGSYATAPLFYLVRLVPLPIAKKWGNQYYDNITVMLSPKFKPKNKTNEKHYLHLTYYYLLNILHKARSGVYKHDSHCP